MDGAVFTLAEETFTKARSTTETNQVGEDSSLVTQLKLVFGPRVI